jgi:hypothetical protein
MNMMPYLESFLGCLEGADKTKLPKNFAESKRPSSANEQSAEHDSQRKLIGHYASEVKPAWWLEETSVTSSVCFGGRT